MAPTDKQLFIDYRAASGNNLSLDLARHLPCRLQAGSIVIVADNPRIFCSVLCKRWMHIVKEVERQACLTLDQRKKRLLLQERDRLQRICVSSKYASNVDILVTTPDDLEECPTTASTLYVTTRLRAHTAQALRIMEPCGLLVAYRACWYDLSRSLAAYLENEH